MFSVGALEGIRRATDLDTDGVNWDDYLAALEAIGFSGHLTIAREVGEDPGKDIAWPTPSCVARYESDFEVLTELITLMPPAQQNLICSPSLLLDERSGSDTPRTADTSQ